MNHIQDEQLDASVTETYMGEWKNDKRCGFGISERSDGLKYEGEWFNNRKYGYGVTTIRGLVEEGKYKNNMLVTSNQKRHLFLIRSAKFRERIDSALNAAQRASKIALQKADIAISRYPLNICYAYIYIYTYIISVPFPVVQCFGWFNTQCNIY